MRESRVARLGALLSLNVTAGPCTVQIFQPTLIFNRSLYRLYIPTL